MTGSRNTEQQKAGLNRITAILLVAIILCQQQVWATGQQTYQLYIQGDSSFKVLNTLAANTGHSLFFPSQDISSINLNGLDGSYTLPGALDTLLNGTPLNAVVTPKGVIVVKMTEPTTKNIGLEGENNMKTQSNKPTTNKTLLASIIAMLFGTGVNAQAVDANQNPDAEQAKTEQSEKASWERIEVTATKRSAWLQDVPAAITAIGAAEIEKRGLKSMGDYLSTVPGVTMQDRGAGANSIVMRGIAVSPQIERTAVGVYFGETPVSGVQNGPNASSSDLRMVDINRVEVLKGPQGTLYGADAMGGIVRIIPNKPEFNETTGSVGAQYSNTAEYGSSNYQLQGVANIPLIDDTLALRAVAYHFDNSGYYQNIAGSYEGDASGVPDAVALYGGVAEDQNDVGNDQTNGVRVSALWQATEALSVNLSHAWQDIEQQGAREEDLSLPGKFQQVRLLPSSAASGTLNGILPQEDGLLESVNITNLSLDYALDWGSIHSASSWNQRDGEYFWDSTYYLSFLFPYNQTLSNEGSVFTQELRFASEFQGPFQLLVGVYYQDWENNYFLTNSYSGDEGKAALANTDSGYDKWAGFEASPFRASLYNTNSLRQKAAFTELSFEITENLSATFGMRYFNYQQRDYARQNGYFVQSEELVVRSDLSNEYNGSTYKANLSWMPSESTLIYAQWAQGFRIGNTQSRKLNEDICDADGNGAYELLGGGEVPISDGLDPDETDNYELGLKTSFANNRISLNASLYHIDWTGLPASVLLEGNGCGGYNVNVGESTSKGIELDTQMLLSDSLKFNLSASYNKAQISGDSTIGEDGDELPGSADFNFSAGLEYAFELAGYPAFARADYAYVGEYAVLLSQPDSIPSAGNYSQVHLKAGVSLGNRLSLDVFVNNLTNADNITWVESLAALRTPTAFRLRPRTLGLNLHYKF